MAGLQNDSGVIQQEAGFGYDGRFWTESISDGVTAKAGGGRTGALPITSMFNRIATVASVADSCVLPPIAQKVGLTICILNDASNSLQMFADGSDTINAVAGSTGVVQMGKSVVWYTAISPGKWHAQGLGSGFSGSNQTYSFQENLTAFAGGGQGSATPVTSSTARFTTVASAGDSAILMTAAAGLLITVINAGAQILNVFPAVGDQINSGGANVAFAIPAGGICDFYTTAAGVWHALLSAPGGAQQVYNSAGNTTAFTATGANICGGTVEVTLDLTGALGGNANLTLPTVANLVTAMTVAGLNPQAGMTYELNIVSRAAANTWTVTTNTGWTLTGAMTVGPTGQMRKFYVTLTSLTAAVLRSIGTWTLGAA